MSKSVLEFYEQLSSDYHLIFKDWENSVRWHSNTLNKIIQKYKNAPIESLTLLDCSCGIGTQAIGLALLGYNVHATDLSPKAVERAQQEAKRMEANMTFGEADFRTLKDQVVGEFDVIITCDNSLPHLLSSEDLVIASENIYCKLKKDGLFLASIRDYDQLAIDRPKILSPTVFDDESGRRIVFQVWDWTEDGQFYTVNLFIVRQENEGWNTTHRVTKYRAIQRKEMDEALLQAGFKDVAWHMPEDTGYYQPIVTARKY